jgi:hypothetical protein
MHDRDFYSRKWRVFGADDLGPVPFHVDVTEYPTGFSLPVRSFTRYTSKYYFSVVIPHWFVLIVLATCATLPWVRWRFSLRTLLIATTLVPVVLGLIVWLR